MAVAFYLKDFVEEYVARFLGLDEFEPVLRWLVRVVAALVEKLATFALTAGRSELVGNE